MGKVIQPIPGSISLMSAWTFDFEGFFPWTLIPLMVFT
jgi:hypothetical protein